jgi:CPA2 family monovalent cation:H+ antiporter-2/glutathione-regulated potassium-efflux system protein KefB
LKAFIAGVMLADSPYRHELEADVDPFRAILLGLFFLSVGMMLDLNAIAERPLFVIGMAVLLIAAKTGIMMGIAMLFKMNWRPALGLGLLLSQGGEFGFVLFAQAKDALLIEPEAASLFGAVVTLSMATTPFLMMFTRRLRADQAISAEGLEPPQSDGASALVIGYGRFGQTVAQMLISQGITVSLIDRDPEMIATAGSFGAKVYYGDGTRLDLLRQAGADNVQLLLFCIDEDQVDAPLLHAVKEAFPEASVFVRVYDRRSLVKLKDAPMAGSVRETLESAIAMARQALGDVGVDSEEITRTEVAYRTRDLDRLKAQAVDGDMHAGDNHLIRGRLTPVEEAG